MDHCQASQRLEVPLIDSSKNAAVRQYMKCALNSAYPHPESLLTTNDVLRVQTCTQHIAASVSSASYGHFTSLSGEHCYHLVSAHEVPEVLQGLS